ncbi:metal ABC transporter ATP-binding protein [soil metagenome]
MADLYRSPALRLDRADVGYQHRSVLVGMSVTVPAGGFVGFVGPSGSGKTTLLRCLLGEADVLAGEVEVFGASVRASRPPRIGYVPQLDRVDWDFPATVEQIVLLGLAGQSARRPWFSRAERRQAHELLERLGLAGLERRPIRTLSGGQQQRMFLARALVHRAELLLLDEPTSGVDLHTRHEILHLLGELNDDGITVVLTTHDLNWVAAHLPRVVCMNGIITADGPPIEVFTPDVLRATYGAEVRVIRDGDLVFVTDPTHVLSRPTSAAVADDVVG